jgi:hypothetical protein
VVDVVAYDDPPSMEGTIPERQMNNTYGDEEPVLPRNATQPNFYSPSNLANMVMRTAQSIKNGTMEQELGVQVGS